jgi:hypothetical protein
MFFATVILLTKMGEDTNVILTNALLLLVGLLGLLGWKNTDRVEQKVDQVKTQTNHTLDDLRRENKELREQNLAFALQLSPKDLHDGAKAEDS